MIIVTNRDWGYICRGLYRHLHEVTSGKASSDLHLARPMESNSDAKNRYVRRPWECPTSRGRLHIVAGAASVRFGPHQPTALSLLTPFPHLNNVRRTATRSESTQSGWWWCPWAVVSPHPGKGDAGNQRGESAEALRLFRHDRRYQYWRVSGHTLLL